MWHEDKCTFCGECLSRCQYVSYDNDRAVQEIKRMIEGEPADILKACVTCCACNEYCPTGANPFDLINSLQERYGSIPVGEKLRKFMDAGATIPTSLVEGDPSKPLLSLCAMEWALPKDAVGGQMFEGMRVAKGGEYFCYLGYVHIGMDTPVRDNARRFIDNLSALKPSEVVFIHADCHAMITKMPEFGIDLPFKPVHIVEYMRDYLRDHTDHVRPLNRKIAYQRPCASRYSGGVEPALDEMFDLIGVERVKRRYDRESALCCGGVFSRINPERIGPYQEKNILDAGDAGAEGMVFLCPLCMGSLAKPAAEKGMKPVFITQLVRMALGELPGF